MVNNAFEKCHEPRCLKVVWEVRLPKATLKYLTIVARSYLRRILSWGIWDVLSWAKVFEKNLNQGIWLGYDEVFDLCYESSDLRSYETRHLRSEMSRGVWLTTEAEGGWCYDESTVLEKYYLESRCWRSVWSCANFWECDMDWVRDENSTVTRRVIWAWVALRFENWHFVAKAAETVLVWRRGEHLRLWASKRLCAFKLAFFIPFFKLFFLLELLSSNFTNGVIHSSVLLDALFANFASCPSSWSVSNDFVCLLCFASCSSESFERLL